MNKIFDVVIVGAGTAGLAALREVKKRTRNFILINDGPWGTVCARVGCMPSKTLIEAANAFHHRGTFDEFGIRGEESLTVDIPAVLRRVRRLRDAFVASTLKATNALGEQAISGQARLLGVGRLVVNGRELHARNIIIATGSHPVVPEAWRTVTQQLLTTDTLFEQETLPRRIAVIGSGPIGIEMAQALSRLGIDIVAFGAETAIAGLSDPRVNAVAIDLLRQEFPLHLGEKADLDAAVMNGGQGGAVRVRGKDSVAVVDSVLVSLGRRPNIQHLGLETLGVELDEQGLPPVDPHTMQIGDLPVFMAGDVNDEKALLHEATDDGHIAGINASRSNTAIFARRTPLAIVFADPGIAMVGKRFESGDSNMLVGEADFHHQGRAQAGQRDRGVLRIYAESESGRLLGAEMCVPAAEHLAHLLALAIERSLTVHDMLRLPFYHPVLEESVRTALRELAAQLPSCGESDLAGCEPLNAEALE
ncbi:MULTISPECIES: dihydrolipoyl dehydrogenase [unclassified Nitrosospira]|uniref:dihydrolipoyl dehydrogenase n=1 Tax=unclassified Nitrosospira TaxID=2609267 RepID=UPI000D327CDD|nr:MULTISPECIES: dihydrolipoyl dehydrogenase [unclassified Nitrosospira]PTR17096.1 dihydrolipoamide dehydrogenase [Nitrosospira sp. Nsp2]WON74557.1 dihydrolipoyl dehydrogenase [Nitrosospira sp. Is2]